MIDSRTTYRFGDFDLDTDRHLLLHDGQEIELQPKVYETLCYLVRHPGRVIEKEELLDHVWSDVAVTENVLTRVISVLRRVLDDRPQASRYIRAVPRVGYRFVCDVMRADSVDTARTVTLTLAVLPFQSPAESDRDESLEWGMADTLISRLSSIDALIVRPLGTVRDCLRDSSDPGTAARKLQVDAFLDAAIQRDDDRVRVTARLVSAHDDATLWAQTFDTRFEGIFELQDDICDKLVKQLVPQLHLANPVQARTTHDAYRAFLEGRLFLSRQTPGDVGTALSRFEKALDADPSYAPAWAGIAEAYGLLGALGDVTSEHYEAARRAGQRALTLDPGLSEALSALAKVAWQFDRDWRGAESMFSDALRRYPNRADLHIAYSDCCCYLGRASLAIEHARRAHTIDPVSPWVNTLLAQALYMAEDYPAAIEQAAKTLELAPDFAFAHFFAGLARFVSGAHSEGINELELAARSGRKDFAAAVGLCSALAGEPEPARQMLESMQSAEDDVPPFSLALLHLGLGDLGAALAAFEQCVENRDWHVLLLHSDPILSQFKTRPEFEELLASLDLP